MTPIFLVSVTPYVGKNVVALGLAEEFRRQGRSVGYFKPIGPLTVRAEGVTSDEDVVFFKGAVGLSEPLDHLCPIVLDEDTLAAIYKGGLKDARARILDAFKIVSAGKDVVISVSMGRLSCGASLGYPMSDFVRDINARVIAVARYEWPLETLDGLVAMREMMPDHFAGVVFNRVPASRIGLLNESVAPFLAAREVNLLGVLPDDAMLKAIRVADIAAALGGEVLSGSDKLDNLVENFSIGAMNVDAALRFFQQVPHKAVITGGDRADIQLAALQTSTRCLILTGGLYPNERILARAEEMGVPVILVNRETSAPAEPCERLHVHSSLRSPKKIARATELVGKALNWDLLNRTLGLK